MMHKLCERMKRALGKTSVCMCVSGVSSDNCTECVFVPQSHAAGIVSEERKQGHISLPYLFISPSQSFPSALEPLSASR